MVSRYAPSWVSEHLAWSVHDGVYFDDLLPLPYTNQTLARVARHVDEVQSALGRPILLENPSTYVEFRRSRMVRAGLPPRGGQAHRLRPAAGRQQRLRLQRRTSNRTPSATWTQFPLEAVGEIHLAGHATETDAQGRPLLIDTHDGPVCAGVWDLYASTLSRLGPTADTDRMGRQATVPGWPSDGGAQGRRPAGGLRGKGPA